jgi:hypothetical protein
MVQVPVGRDRKTETRVVPIGPKGSADLAPFASLRLATFCEFSKRPFSWNQGRARLKER